MFASTAGKMYYGHYLTFKDPVSLDLDTMLAGPGYVTSPLFPQILDKKNEAKRLKSDQSSLG